MTVTQIVIANSSIMTACKKITVGTKVTNRRAFYDELAQAIENFDWSTCPHEGQAYIPLPDKAVEFVSAGVGRRTLDPEDYVAQRHRGHVNLYLKREGASRATQVAAVVYSRKAYLADPEVTEEVGEATHVLVAVLAYTDGPSAPLTPLRFVSNLAGGNNEAKAWGADEIREKAKKIQAYDDDWCVVAD